MLAVDVDTSFTSGHCNSPSWFDGHGPGLGERTEKVVREIDLQRFEAMMVDASNRKTRRPRAERGGVHTTFPETSGTH